MKDAQLHLDLGYQNPWRIQQLGAKLTSIKLADVIYGSEDTSEKRLLIVFLYKHGKFKEFIELISDNRKRGYNTFVEASFRKTLSELQPDWTAYLKDIDNNRNAIYQIPASVVYSNEEEYLQKKSLNW